MESTKLTEERIDLRRQLEILMLNRKKYSSYLMYVKISIPFLENPKFIENSNKRDGIAAHIKISWLFV